MVNRAWAEAIKPRRREQKPWHGLGLPKKEVVRLRRKLDPAYREYDILRAFVRKKRLRAASDGTVTVSRLRDIKARTMKCYLCRRRLFGKTVFDHVTPIAAGGAHSMSNLAVVHEACNMRKAAQQVTML